MQSIKIYFFLLLLTASCSQNHESRQFHFLSNLPFDAKSRDITNTILIHGKDTLPGRCSCKLNNQSITILGYIPRPSNSENSKKNDAFTEFEIRLDSLNRGSVIVMEASKVPIRGVFQSIDTFTIEHTHVKRGGEIEATQGGLQFTAVETLFMNGQTSIHFKCRKSEQKFRSSYNFFEFSPHQIPSSYTINKILPDTSSNHFLWNKNYYFIQNDSTYYLLFSNSDGHSGESYFLKVCNQSITSSFTFGMDVPNELTAPIYDFEYHQLSVNQNPMTRPDTLRGTFLFVSDPEPNLYGKVHRKHGYFEATHKPDAIDIPFFYLDQKID